MPFPRPPASRVAMEESVLETWRREGTFAQSLEATRDGPEFVFYEGPPTANGRPGLHHVISRAIKDLVCRYQTMRGRHVTRIAGWDTHGLPVEIEAQKQLGIEDKKEIEARGIAWFNEQCRASVFAYKDEWERFSERIGYWLDYSRPYVTFDAAYIESVWWLFKQMAERDLLYRGHKVVPWCPRDRTVLSSHELSLGYRDVEDPSLYLTVELLDGSGRHLLVWTTTPWTLVANTALAVNPNVEYVEVDHAGKRVVVARDRAAALLGEDRTTAPVPVDQLLGRRYRRPFDLVPEAAAQGRAWEVVAGDFVSADEGSGIVHLAPAYGADDYQAGKELGLAVLEPLRADGAFDPELPLVGGQFFKDADEPLVEDLKARGHVVSYAREVHSYPHCWRCEAPLVYMARHSWFARTSALRKELLENNAQVAWHPPEAGQRRFGDWLEGNVDWALSRDRYWGTPLPVWVSEDDPSRVEWIGSLAELAEKAGGLPEDFDPHRPFIDQVTWTCPDTGAVMRRTPEVLDVWFDSGAMPWAQWHYPFENQERFRRHFPADFICEAVDQTRGWFYSLHAISTMLGLGPAFRNVIVNDLILDAAGRKMSKSRGNVVDPWAAVAEHGADGVRWYMITVSNPWLPTRFDSAQVQESASRFFDTLFNTYRFFALYADVEGWTPEDAERAPPPARRPVLDRWLLSRLNGLVDRVRRDLDAYAPTRAYREVASFLDGDLSNWYVRRARPRFWGAERADDSGGGGDSGPGGDSGAAAFATLHEALCATALLLAPVVPFASDWLHRALTGRSSHLERFPEPNRALIDEALEREMAVVRTLCTLGRAAREDARVRVRQPLGRIFAVVPGDPPAGPALALLKDELNVKSVEFAGSTEEVVTLSARPNYRALGRRFRQRTEEVATRVRALSPDALKAFRGGAPLDVELDGERHALGPDDLEVVEDAQGVWVVRSEGRCTVALDPTVTEALRREGLARELVSRVQRLRREAGLEVTDRIVLSVGGTAAVEAAAREHRAVVAGETLAVAVEVGGEGLDASNEHAWRRETTLDGEAAVLRLSRA